MQPQLSSVHVSIERNPMANQNDEIGECQAAPGVAFGSFTITIGISGT
jgi:hypothetical protein